MPRLSHPRYVFHRVALVLCAAFSLNILVPSSQAQDSVRHAEALSDAFRRASEAVLPTVVTIRTHTKARQIEPSENEGNPLEGTPFEDFFGDDFGDMLRRRQIPEQDGIGSGVIIDPSGVILTNNHVVGGGDASVEIEIELPDGPHVRSDRRQRRPAHRPGDCENRSCRIAANGRVGRFGHVADR